MNFAIRTTTVSKRGIQKSPKSPTIAEVKCKDEYILELEARISKLEQANKRLVKIVKNKHSQDSSENENNSFIETQNIFGIHSVNTDAQSS